MAGPHVSAKDAADHAFAEVDRLRAVNADLLEALKAMVEDYEGAYGGSLDETPTCLINARAAIARAEGGT